MSTTPRTDANCFSATTERPSSGDFELEVVYADFARGLERDAALLRKELETLTTDFQAVCPHEDWEKVDNSFSHEFGTQVIRFEQCTVCGKHRDWDDEGPEPDYDAEKPLTPMQNHQRNDEHNVP